MQERRVDPAHLRYPPAERIGVVDDYHGTPVADPYRWLEEAETPATRAWVAAQNALTARVVGTPERAAIRARLEQLYNFPRGSAPLRRGGRYFFGFNDGLQNQPVIHVLDREAPAGTRPEPRLLIDPNTLSDDGTAAVTALSPSHDGRLVAYAVSRAGSDRQDIHVREVDGGADLDDHVRWAKFTALSWTLDGLGFFYTRFPEPGTVPPGDEQYFAEVRYHRLGQPAAEDRRVFHRPDDREAVMTADVSFDGRWLVITVFKGASDVSEIYVSDLAGPATVPAPLFTGFQAAYTFVEAVDGRLYFRTTAGAPMGCLIAVDLSGGVPALPPSGAVPSSVVVPESGDNLVSVRLVHRHVVAVYLHNASDRVRLFGLDGRPGPGVPLPVRGSLSGLTGAVEHEELFFRLSSFTEPPAVYRYEFATGEVSPWTPVARRDPAAPAAARSFVTTQVWYPSKDGTRISMFLVHPRDGRPGPRPVLLTGYGGFTISLTPQYDPANFLWLEYGGAVAVPNLRGGGEYGEAWHRAGMLGRKQTVFDDFIAAADWLVATGRTTPRQLVIEGASNGGLLVGAVLVQRPDLVGAVICRVPVVDMLRFHRFTVGRYWIAEYGSADDPEQFPFLHAYSPLHNVHDGVAYPPTLVMTADTDDRVDPGMAKKFAARLQAATAGVEGAGPILIRVETAAGHGAGKPVAKLLDEEADIHAFLRVVVPRPD